MTMDWSSWLTRRRLRAHAIILAACLWSLYVWNLSTPGLLDRAGHLKGTDFLHFYTLGSEALAHDGADLYDMRAQAQLAAERVPEASGIKYLPLYPPQVSMLFAPLARLPYAWALGIWWACTVIIYAGCCYAIWHACPHLRDDGPTVVVLGLAYPAFFHLIAWGQTSALALVCFTGMFFLLRGRREFLAGLALGCLVFKPQLGLAAAVLFFFLGAWRVVLGALLSAAAETAVGVFYYGAGPLRQWVSALRKALTFPASLEPKPYQTHSLRSFWSMLVPWHRLSLGLYVVSAIVILYLLMACWKSKETPLAIRYSLLLLATVLIAPHLTVYDLVILAPAILLLADWLVAQPDLRIHGMIGTLLYFVFALPLIGPLARYTHLQLSVVAMAWLAYALWKVGVNAKSLIENGEPSPAEIAGAH